MSDNESDDDGGSEVCVENHGQVKTLVIRGWQRWVGVILADFRAFLNPAATRHGDFR